VDPGSIAVEPRKPSRRARLVTYGILALAGVASAMVLTLLLWDRGTNAADRLSYTHEHARAAFEGFELPTGYLLTAEQELGMSPCLFGDCLRVQRYYTSLQMVDAACIDLLGALEVWGATNVVDAGAVPCNFSGRLGRWDIQAQVVPDATIDDYGTSGDRPINEPHNSVAIVAVRRP
jgi:hypothetical protein